MTAASSGNIDSDYYDWIHRQARALREHRPRFLDWENLAEELDAMGRSEESALESQLERVLAHLLKWSYQPTRRSGSWEASIENGRDLIERQLKKSPSLKHKLSEMFEAAYPLARRNAGADMGLDKRQWEERFPDRCPWGVDEVMDHSFWPEAAELSRRA
jgi:hypothetical protein